MVFLLELLVAFLSMLGVSLAGCPITPRSPQPRSSRLIRTKFAFSLGEAEHSRRRWKVIRVLKFIKLLRPDLVSQQRSSSVQTGNSKQTKIILRERENTDIVQ